MLKSHIVSLMIPKKDYMGLVIMAIKDGNDWYVDGRRRKSIPARNGEIRNIRPGYIIMKASEDLEFGGRTISLHEALLEDFFGRSVNDLASEGLFISGIGFSYQTLDTKTGSYLCDFKFRSGKLFHHVERYFPSPKILNNAFRNFQFMSIGKSKRGCLPWLYRRQW